MVSERAALCFEEYEEKEGIEDSEPVKLSEYEGRPSEVEGFMAITKHDFECSLRKGLDVEERKNELGFVLHEGCEVNMKKSRKGENEGNSNNGHFST